jgi:hypothetical protein
MTEAQSRILMIAYSASCLPERTGRDCLCGSAEAATLRHDYGNFTGIVVGANATG